MLNTALLNLPFVHDGDQPQTEISLGYFQMLGGEPLGIFRHPKDLDVVPFGSRLPHKQPCVLPAPVPAPVDDF